MRLEQLLPRWVVQTPGSGERVPIDDAHSSGCMGASVKTAGGRASLAVLSLLQDRGRRNLTTLYHAVLDVPWSEGGVDKNPQAGTENHWQHRDWSLHSEGAGNATMGTYCSPGGCKEKTGRNNQRLSCTRDVECAIIESQSEQEVQHGGVLVNPRKYKHHCNRGWG